MLAAKLPFGFCLAGPPGHWCFQRLPLADRGFVEDPSFSRTSFTLLPKFLFKTLQTGITGCLSTEKYCI
jgi:hypothetical protein